jgi:molybdate transport system regulatory protein
MSELRIRSKIWLEIDGQSFLGDGRYRMLAAVQRHGSISAAARDLGLSYRKVWARLQAMEKASPFPLLERRVGGKDGGATILTAEVLGLMKHYQAMREMVNAEADRCFLECFGQDVGDAND